MNKLMIKLINFYQQRFSHLLGKNCRYTPTCSQYAKEAYGRFNFFKATYLTIYRILRCNPFSKGGYDPVPPKRKRRRKKESSFEENGGLLCSVDEATEKE